MHMLWWILKAVADVAGEVLGLLVLVAAMHVVAATVAMPFVLVRVLISGRPFPESMRTGHAQVFRAMAKAVVWIER